jgi:phosphate transport system substrate-binding protein
MRMIWFAIFALLFDNVFVGAPLVAQQGDAFGYPYAPEKPIAGELQLVGSTLMQPLASLWVEGFRDTHPEMKAVIDCKGSELSFPLFTSDKPTIGMFSRAISDEELKTASTRQNEALHATTVAYDVLAVIVHPENPITMLRWDAERSSLWNGFGNEPIKKWGDLGGESPLGDSSILLQLPTAEHGLRNLAQRFLVADLTPEQYVAHEVDKPWDIGDAVLKKVNSIALISATHARGQKVKALPIQIDGGRLVSPFDDDSVAEGYPLVRELTLVFPLNSEGQRHPLIDEFLSFALSIRGQRIVHQDGFLPLGASVLDEQRERLGWEVVK